MKSKENGLIEKIQSSASGQHTTCGKFKISIFLYNMAIYCDVDGAAIRLIERAGSVFLYTLEGRSYPSSRRRQVTLARSCTRQLTELDVTVPTPTKIYTDNLGASFIGHIQLKWRWVNWTGRRLGQSS